MANTKVTQHVIANNAITADQISSAAVTDAKLHSTLDLSGKTLTLPATAIPSASTATTQSASDNSTKLATTAYVTTAIANLNDSAPSALNTLNELAAALNDDASFSTTITTALGTKAPLANPTFTTAINGGDNVKLQLGDSQEFQLYHTGSGNSIISETGSGSLYIDGTNIYLRKSTSSGEALADFVGDGAVKLYYNGSEKLETTTTGVSIIGTGALRIPQGTTGQRPSAATGQIRWNTTDGALEVYNGSAWTAVGTGTSNKVLDTFTGNGSNATFTLSVTPANEDAIMVFIDGAYQEKADYTLTNNSLVLDTAPLNNEKIAVHTTTASVHDGTSAVNQQFTATAGQTAFTLSQDPSSENNTQVYINGVYQQKTDYTVSGTTLTFDTGLTVGDVVEVNMFTVTTLGNTDTVTEGVGNLYHTTARARSAISVSGNALSYNSSSGVITANFEESPAFTGNVDVAGNITVGNNDSILAENNLRFKSAGAAYIDHNTTGQSIVFRTSNSSALDTQALILDHLGNLTIRSGGKLIINRTDNATGGEITYGPSAGTGFTFNDANSDGIDFKTGSTMLMSIDSTNQKVGVGAVSSPAGKLHVYSGDAGAVTPSSQADDLVVENSAEGGITIMTPDDQSARIRFTSPSTESGDEGGADIFYRQNINKMSMGTVVSGGKLAFKSGAGVETMVLDNGNVSIGNSSYGSSLGQLRIINDAASAPASLSLFGYSNISDEAEFAKIDFASQISGTGGNPTAKIAANIEGANERAAHLTFHTHNDGGSLQERMRITSDGRIGIDNNGAAWVDANDKFITNGRGVFRGYGHSPLALGRYNSGGTAGEAGSMLAFLYGGAGVGSINITTNSTQYNTTSDIRLKENIQTIVDGSSKIMAMNPVSHTWKDNPTEDAVHGFIAQEMKDIVPESVTGEPEGEEMMQMDYGRITPVIVAGLQDALKEIEKLKERINELENK